MTFTKEMLDQISLDKAYAFYKTCFSDASAFTFTFVGNLDTATVIPLLERYLGSLPSTHAGVPAKGPCIQIPSGEITKYVYKGIEDKATVQLLFGEDVRSNGWWLGYLTTQLENGDDLSQVYKHAGLVNEISVSEVQQAAAKFLSGNNFIHFELRPTATKQAMV